MHGSFSNAVHVDQLGLIGVALQPSAQAFVVQGFASEDYYAQLQVLRTQRLFRRSRGHLHPSVRKPGAHWGPRRLRSM